MRIYGLCVKCLVYNMKETKKTKENLKKLQVFLSKKIKTEINKDKKDGRVD